MFTPFAHAATALSLFMSAQLTLPSVSRAWVSEPTHRCSSASRDQWNDKAVPRKAKATGGGSASRTVRIVTFGP
jgi:hypothetical protein